MTALVYYTDTGGADTNSGTSAGTSPDNNGTGATRSGAVYTLDGSPDLSGVTVNVDAIHIVGETSGRGNDGTLFEITAVDDGADTVTVDPTPTGGTSGLTWAIGGAFATIDKAMNVVAAGDKVWVKASGTYSETPNIDTAGTGTNSIVFEGYSSTTGDNGKVTVSGTTNNLTSGVNAPVYYNLKNFIFSGASSYGVSMVNTDSICWVNCEFNSNGNHGIFADNNHTFVNCVAHSNSGMGFDVDTQSVFVGCIAYGNSGTQINALGGNYTGHCVVYQTGSNKAIETDAVAYVNNTIDGENTATVGLVFPQQISAACYNNIIYDCVTGVEMNAGTNISTFVGYNLVNSNSTSDYTALTDPNTIQGFKDVTGAPAFTDEANDDYTLGASSPAIDAGIQPGGIT